MKKQKRKNTTTITAKAFAENCGLTKAQYDNYVEWCGGGLASFEDFCKKSAEQVTDILDANAFAFGQLGAITNGGEMILAAISIGGTIINNQIYLPLQEPLESSEMENSIEFSNITFQMDGIGFQAAKIQTVSEDGFLSGIFFEIESMFDRQDSEFFPF